jgi:hypothetical protein
MRATSIIDDAPKDISTFGLDNPWSTITVESDTATAEGGVDTKREMLLLGHPFDINGDARYGQYDGRPSVFKVSAADVKTLSPDAATLVSKAPMPIARADIKQITIDGPDGRFTITKHLDGWQISIEGGADQTGDNDRIALLLNLLTSPANRVAIASSQETPGAFLARVNVEGLSGRTSRDITITRLDTDGQVEAVLADGSGAVRYKDGAMLVEFTPDAYLGSAADNGEGNGPPVEPVK